MAASPSRLPPSGSDEALPPQEELFCNSSEDPGLPRPLASLDFEDRREERRRNGLLKWQLEQGVPDVGGLGWRSRTGHILKNQTYYAVNPKEHLWDNPAHAGPKTWKEWHGPKLRSDAPLMARLDRLDADQEEWETKKNFVNAVRVQTLDRFYHHKVENQQKEMASQWAPHRRARKEVHQSFDCFMRELDSMPAKELKKVLTPKVLSGDRDAIRMITKRVQVEDTWKAAWKQMERDRRDDTRACHEQRQAYNEMLMELAGQPPRRRNPDHALPNNCTPRVEELARPVGPRHAGASGGVTQLVDYSGLIHVDHKHALEARFPGRGHAMSTEFAVRASESARPGWPPPPPPETPQPSGGRPRPSQVQEALRRGSAPVSEARMRKTLSTRQDMEVMSRHASEQFLPAAAPPPPQQRDMLLREPLVNDPLHMSQDLSPRSEHTSRDRMNTVSDNMELAPPRRSTVYPVVVPTVEAAMERPGWRPKRAGRGPGTPGGRRGQASSSSQSASARERWPPVGSQTVSVTVVKVSGLPKADRSGHSDPYAVCQVLGKARSRAKTKVVGDTEDPVFNEELTIQGWRQGEPLVLSVFDHDLVGKDDVLATVQFASAEFYPEGFSGVVPLRNMWSADGQRIDDELKAFNLAAAPTMEVRIAVQEEAGDVPETGPEASLGGSGGGRGYAELAMPGAEPSMRAVCDHLDDFEANLAPVPRLGNFWMTPRSPGAGRSGGRGRDGAAEA